MARVARRGAAGLPGKRIERTSPGRGDSVGINSLVIMVEGSGAACAYELDESFRLTAVDAAFASFAVANGAPELQPPGCLGRSVMAGIADVTTAYVYRQLFNRVRRDGRAVTVPIRCDSPTQRRFLDLRVEPRPRGYRILTSVTRLEQRPHQALLDTSRASDGEPLRMCSWCARLDVEDRWLPVEDAVTALRLLERVALPAITHGICEGCYDTMQQTIGP